MSLADYAGVAEFLISAVGGRLADGLSIVNQLLETDEISSVRRAGLAGAAPPPPDSNDRLSMALLLDLLRIRAAVYAAGGEEEAVMADYEDLIAVSAAAEGAPRAHPLFEVPYRKQ